MIETALCRGKHGSFRYLPTDQFIGGSLELYGEYSEMELGLLLQLVSEGDTIVEVGANIGALTVPLARKAGKAGRVIAFEPQGRIFEVLQENLGLNELVNVRAEPCAVGSHRRVSGYTLPDYSKPGNFGAVEMGRGDRIVPVTTIDALELKQLRMLKIDVEGMEAEVLRGARETIKRCWPLLYVENDRLEKSAELISLVFELGYRAWWHLPPLYNPRNVRGCAQDIFRGLVSINMLCVPADVAVDINLLEITSPDADWHKGSEFDRAVAGAGVKTVAVVRPGAYGDALWASSILPHLKAEGYHVTVYTERQGGEILRHDPHIDRLIVNDPAQIQDMQAFWDAERPKYDRWINLVESVEGVLLALPWQPRYNWPQELRHARMNENYLEHIHALAQVPYKPAVRFYPTEEERAWAADKAAIMLDGAQALIAIAASGSTAPKWWPHLDELLELLAHHIGDLVQVAVLGDLKKLDRERAKQWPNVSLIGTDWTIREALAFAQLADAVVGQETGILNAVSLEPMPKIVLLSHSSRRNLTVDWVNTVELHGAPDCYPCHQVHYDLSHCTVDQATGASACQAQVHASAVLAILADRLKLREQIPAELYLRTAQIPYRKAVA
jgi:FkbM family methyltransferase